MCWSLTFLPAQSLTPAIHPLIHKLLDHCHHHHLQFGLVCFPKVGFLYLVCFPKVNFLYLVWQSLSQAIHPLDPQTAGSPLMSSQTVKIHSQTHTPSFLLSIMVFSAFCSFTDHTIAILPFAAYSDINVLPSLSRMSATLLFTIWCWWCALFSAAATPLTLLSLSGAITTSHFLIHRLVVEELAMADMPPLVLSVALPSSQPHCSPPHFHTAKMGIKWGRP